MQAGNVASKSSNEILTELFSSFNAAPPRVAVDDIAASNEKDRKKNKKSKKSKKKQKSKKHKKKRSSTSSDNSSSSEEEKQKSRKKRKLEVPIEGIPHALDLLLETFEKPTPVDIPLPAPTPETAQVLNCQENGLHSDDTWEGVDEDCNDLKNGTDKKDKNVEQKEVNEDKEIRSEVFREQPVPDSCKLSALMLSSWLREGTNLSREAPHK